MTFIPLMGEPDEVWLTFNQASGTPLDIVSLNCLIRLIEKGGVP